uniref:Uncharacterized protein n=1 Tax=Arundo donax TaxID=35708 RepID=A0A0A9BNV6_ARUDO
MFLSYSCYIFLTSLLWFCSFYRYVYLFFYT